jgi:hypothetical protein
LADEDSSVYECPVDPTPAAAKKGTCYNPNDPSIFDQVDDDAGVIEDDLSGDGIDEDEVITYDLSGQTRLTAVLADEIEAEEIGDNLETPGGEATTGTGESCKKRVPPASEEELKQMLFVLRDMMGWDISQEQLAVLVDKGILDKDEILKKYEPSVTPNPTFPPPAAPPCVEWDEEVGCLSYGTSLPGGDSFAFSTNRAFGTGQAVSTNPQSVVLYLINLVLSISGGVALILIILSGYKIMTSSGRPDAVQEGRDQLVSAIVGLIFIIFSFVIYQLIVVDILRVPGIN